MADSAHGDHLRDDVRRVCSRCGNVLTGGGVAAKHREARKRVTVIFTDIVGSTALTEELEPEVLRLVGLRFHQTAREVLKGYGASIQALGDGMMAVFGLPRIHEDDAVHAIHAAVEIHNVLPQLNDDLERGYGIRIDLHTGVHTGEIVTVEGVTPGGEVLSHTINVARRFMEAAGTGQIFMSRATYELVRAIVETEPLESLDLKGVHGLSSAWRLLSIRADGRAGPRRTPVKLIGREPEIRILRAAYVRTVERRIWRVVKVLGDAGVGRSSLVEIFTRTLIGDPQLDPSPLVLWGYCSSYFTGARANPIAQILRHAAGIQPDHTASEARAHLRDLAGGDERLTARVAPLLDLPGSPGQPQETWRALRRLLEMLANRQPVVLVIDDLHAAAPEVRRMVEEVAASPSHVPILLVCTIRSESLDKLHDWGTHLPEVESFRTPLLDREEAHELIRALLPVPPLDEKVIEIIGERAQGNPLQIKEFIAAFTDTQADSAAQRPVTIADLAKMQPAATLEAVLESRLEGLTAHERLVVDAAAVIGASFTPAEVGALCPTQEPGVILDLLDALEHKELLAVDADLERFVLRPPYREVAYRCLTKQLRSDLHIHFASLLESAAELDDQRPEIDARIGRHLDMAYQYQKELHRDLTDSTRELARRAGEHFAAAGHVYCMQLFPDPSTALHLQRATELLAAQVPTGRQARLDLANLLQEEQPELALALYDAVLQVAGTVQDWSVGQQARLGRMEVTWFHNFQGDWKEGCAEVTRLLDELITPLSRAKALRLLAHAYAATGRADDAIDAIRRASMIVQETGDRRLETKILELACVLLFWGPLHLDDVIEQIQRFVDRAEQQGLYNLQASALSILARATAMLGDFEHARELLQQAKSIRPVSKDLLTIGTDAISEGLVELLAGRLDAAEQILHDGYEWLRQQDASVALASLAVMLGRVHLRRGNQHEAERFVGEAKAAAVETHFDAQIKWRSLQAIIDARRGKHDTAESLALEASALAEQSGQPDTRAEALLDLTEVLRLAGRRQEATEAANMALRIYENRGSPILAGQVQQILDALKTDKTPSA